MIESNVVESMVDDWVLDEEEEDEDYDPEYDRMIMRLMKIADEYGYEFDHLMGAYLGGCLDSYFPMGLPDSDEYMLACDAYFDEDDD